MKHSLIKMIFASIFLVVISSCSKTPNKILPKKNGQWTMIWQGTDSWGDPINESMTAFFSEGGTGNISNQNGTSTFNWFYTFKNKTITLTFSVGTHSVIYNFQVNKTKGSHEEWELLSLKTDGAPETYQITATLDKL